MKNEKTDMDDIIGKKVTYYLRNDKNQPITTVSIIKDTLGNTSRGVAFCNSCDNFLKDEGRFRAHHRALKALFKEKSFSKIGRPELLKDDLFTYKCEFMPKLTKFEKELLTEPI